MLKNRPILKRLKKHIPEKLPKQIASLLPTIHLMIVANTKDPLIGRGCKRDAKAMRELFGKLTEFIHIPLVEFTGRPCESA
jgi:CO dehydrogenase/acetyl-CoA synthase epsilon subunit